MTRIILISLFITLFPIILYTQEINYSPAHFGPNANPVPEFNNAHIPTKTTFTISENYYFGVGDNTNNFLFSVEFPFLSERLSVKIWNTFFETFEVTEKTYNERNMQNGSLKGRANGDIYIKNRIRLFSEKKIMPSIILNNTLKTASGTNFKGRRYFDTPGYYFDVEFGKSFHLNNKIINEIRTVANAGFMCWETSGSKQNDAPMYGLKFILSNNILSIENTIAGYYGWMNNGDAPLVYSSRLIYKHSKFRLFAQYQYGINDFPYHYIQAGVSFELAKLTPWYNKK